MGVFVVTGATAGIGRQVTAELLGDGHDVVAVARSADTSEGLKSAGAVVFAADVASQRDVGELVAMTRGRFASVDGLVNSAGILRRGRLEEQDPASFEEVMRTNVLGTMLVTRAFIPLLRRPGGSVVNVTSSLLGRPVPGVSAYAASKGAVFGFTRAMAIELAGDGIRVNSVSPGLVRSDIFLAGGMAAEEYEGYLEQRKKLYPLGRIGEPMDVSAAIRFLLSSKSDWVTGVDMPVDGGISVNIAS